MVIKPGWQQGTDMSFQLGGGKGFFNWCKKCLTWGAHTPTLVNQQSSRAPARGKEMVADREVDWCVSKIMHRDQVVPELKKKKKKIPGLICFPRATEAMACKRLHK